MSAYEDFHEITLCVPSLRGGGVEGAMVRLANELAGRGFAVNLLAVKAEGAWAEHVSEHVNVIDLDKPRVLAAFGKLRNYLSRRQGVFVSNMTHLNVVSILASLFLRTRTMLFVVEHNDMQVRLDRLSPFAAWLARRLLAVLYRRSDQVLAVSRDLAKDIERILGVEEGFVRVLHNGIDLDAVRDRAQQPVPVEILDSSKPLITAIGRLVPQKGFSVLLDAAALIQNEMEFQLVILGEGPLRPELEAQAERLGISGSVSFPGFVSEPFSLLKRADLFVLSSLYEGFGIVVLEAMVCGTPVVATDCHWGPAELLMDGEAGLLVPPRDPQALAGAILESLWESGAAASRALRAEKSAERFSVGSAADALLMLVESSKAARQ